MKTVILAGGLGTRLSEETAVRPKPMVEIGGKPILWHVMKIYSRHGFNDFVVCLGYKGFVIKDYFLNYARHNSNLTVDLRNNSITIHDGAVEPWSITLIDTGQDTQTGGRLKRLAPLMRDEEFFCTYGDGVGDVDISAVFAQHKRGGRIATVTATIPAGRFGALHVDGGRVTSFTEKPHGGDGWINAGFFVFNRRVFDYIDSDETSLEQAPLVRLTQENQLTAYFHHGFWQPMDTLRDKRRLDELCEHGAPWLED